MKYLLIEEFCLRPGQNGEKLETLLRSRFKADLRLLKILKRSIDARKKKEILIKYRLVISAEDAEVPNLLARGCKPWIEEEALPSPGPARRQRDVIILGSGPAGLFAALRLAERGLRPRILERGKRVEERHGDVVKLRSEGILDPESNIVFGEGGAGTYSDGKLTTRIRAEEIHWFYEKLIEHGADPAIRYETKPHIGTDALFKIVASIRNSLEALGCRYEFGARVKSLIMNEGKFAAFRCADGSEYGAETAIIACGHSARDFYQSLEEQGMALEAKGFAVGLRIEHPAEFINRAQYGEAATLLPAADYRLTWNNARSGRGCYSFCMCPGGEVVNSSSEAGMLCVNGMSYSDRALAFSNAAIVVSVKPEDCGPSGLGGIAFQRELEGRAFAAGGGGFFACAQSAQGFLGRGKKSVNASSYRPGTREADFHDILPSFISDELVAALADFDRKIPGFVSEGSLLGVETRTSSPLRILRGQDGQSLSHPGIYPVGEGSGYSGGIVSSAVDGIKAADRIADSI